ncbi:MAG: PIN domain-containing protein [Frankiaceae bacterium]|nr:PIN domain-containing protein [Frankiaceae bacterium]
MTPEVGVLDTSAVIVLHRLADPSMLPVRPVISAITLAELAVGPLVARGAEAALRQQRLQQAEADLTVLPFDEDAARAFATVAASLRRRGRKTKARAFDTLIAATALSRGLPLYTCNPADFAGIDGLVVHAVPQP